MSGTGEYAVFSGSINLNGGGFAGQHVAVSGGSLFSRRATGVSVAVRGDGQLYKVVLEEEGSGRGGVSYQCDFVAPREWSTVRLPFAAFKPSWRGRTVPEAGPIRPEAAGRIGLRLSLLADSGQPNKTLKEGAFRADVRAIAPYR
jgi:hypothetical protein